MYILNTIYLEYTLKKLLKLKRVIMNELPIMSVSGIRGKMGESLDVDFFSKIAYLQTKAAGGGKIIVGRDTRPSGPELAAAAFRGIRAAGGIPVDIGIAPTPTTCFAVEAYEANGGIIITASHNPLPYNGYKMVHSSARLYSGTECDTIYNNYHSGEYLSSEEINSFSSEPEESFDAVTAHVNSILKAIDVRKIQESNISIAVDSINGAAGVIFPKLCEALSVKWVGVHNKLDGDFVHNPEPRPEHLTDLKELLTSTPDVWGGFVFDPDADRLATMGENGEPISEEMTLALALENVLPKQKTLVATNLSTSMVIDEVAAKHGCEVLRTKIGEANVVEGMRANNCIIGGEGNGGIIYPQISTVRDGLTGLALILELMAQTGKKLTELTAPLPVYPIVKEKIELGDLKPEVVVEKLSKEFSEDKIDLQDGIKIIRDYGWVHLRASNTEPIMRCYAEAKTQEQAQELAKTVMDMI